MADFDQERRSSFLGWAFALTLIVHWLVWWQLGTFPIFSPSEKSKSAARDDVIELSPLPKDPHRKPIQETEKAPNRPDLKNKEAHYEGEFTNRVEKETNAQKIGKFKSSEATPRGGKEQRPLGPEGSLPYSLSDLMPKFSAGESASEQMLPGVAKGAKTLLNTDAVSYAGFFNRVQEAIYDSWVSNYYDAVRDPQVQRQLRAQDYVVRLLAVIDAKGQIAGVQVVQSCGIQALDDAIVKAFWANNPFRNPPKQLLDKDGYFRMGGDYVYIMGSSMFRTQKW